MKRHKFLQAIVIITVSLFIATCKKDKIICNGYTELSGQGHLADLSVLNPVPEFLDSLKKYPDLQVSSVISDQYGYTMHCNIFYKGLIVFHENYMLSKSKRDNHIYQAGVPFIDSINFSLIPLLQYEKAVDIAKQNIDFSNTCIFYRLGIYDLNISYSTLSQNYKLVWKIQGEYEDVPYVILDANTGVVYKKCQPGWVY